MRGTPGHWKLAGLLPALCIAACATSNYAPVVYHDNTGTTGGAPVISTGDMAASRDAGFATAGVKPVASEALGATVESLPAPTGAVEAEQPHGLAPPDPRYSVTPYEQQRAASLAPPRVEANTTIIAPDAPVPVGREQPYEVVVQPGDTLYSLSRAHTVDHKAIIAANNLQAPYALRMGERLVIPKGAGVASAGASAPMTASAPSRTVMPGDTLYSIAREEHADVREIALLNNIAPPYGLRAGQQLKLPVGASGTMMASRGVSSSAGGPLLHPGESPVPPASVPPTEQKASLKNTAKTPFIWPVSGKIISTFGPKESGRRNDGVNIAAPVGTIVRAARSGEIIYVGNELRGYGNLVLIRHDDGFVSAYAHNSRILVKRGAFVQQGQQIAESGDTGSVTEPQVHFEIRKDRHPIDPLGHLPKV